MTIEERIKHQIGELVFQVHNLQDQLETANVKIAELEKANETKLQRLPKSSS